MFCFGYSKNCCTFASELTTEVLTFKSWIMNTKKYALTSKTIDFADDNGKKHTLHKIIALKDFGGVKVGDFGGWVESDDNLSHVGNCWVSDDAKVMDEAYVANDALISGNCELHDQSFLLEKSSMEGYAKVYGCVIVSGRSAITDSAQVIGCGCVCDENIGGSEVRYITSER